MSQMIFKIENPVWQRIVRNLYTKYDKEFYSYPAAKTNHHAFETGLAYHTATMVRLLMLLARSILSSIRVCFMRGLCCMTWLKLSSWRDQIRPSTRSEAIFLDISLWLIVKLPRPLWNLALMIPRKKSFCFVTSSSVTTACLSMEVQSVHALWKQRLSIWLTIWMQCMMMMSTALAFGG